MDIYNGETENSGLNVPIHEERNFEAVGKLGDLGLGFFSYITIPIYKGGFEITFTGNKDNNALFCWKGKKSDGTDSPSPPKGKVIIDTFY